MEHILKVVVFLVSMLIYSKSGKPVVNCKLVIVSSEYTLNTGNKKNEYSSKDIHLLCSFSTLLY